MERDDPEDAEIRDGLDPASGEHVAQEIELLGNGTWIVDEHFPEHDMTEDELAAMFDAALGPIPASGETVDEGRD